MGAILRAGSGRLWFPGRVKPTGIPKIDWSHPLAKELVFYAFDTGMGPIIDLVTGVKGAPTYSGTPKPTSAATIYGSMLQYNGGVATIFNPNLGNFRAPSAVNSWAASFYSTLAGQAGVGGLAIKNAPTGSVGYLDAEYYTAPPFDKMSCYGNTNLISGGAVGPTLNAFVSFVITGDGTTERAYQNGVFVDSSVQADPVLDTTTQIVIGDYADAPWPNFPFTGVIPYLGIWNRTLTVADAMKLNLDPYCFLLPQFSGAALASLSSRVPYNPWPQAAPILAQ